MLITEALPRFKSFNPSLLLTRGIKDQKRAVLQNFSML